MVTCRFITVKFAQSEASATVTSAHPEKFVGEGNFVADGAVVQTIKGISKHRDVRVEAYSDQPPSSVGGKKSATSIVAHSKGFFALGKDTGFHVLHSLPWGPFFSQSEKFTDPKDWFRQSSTKGVHSNGQMFLCTSHKAKSLRALVKIINSAQVHRYFCNKQQCLIDPDMRMKNDQANIEDYLQSLGEVRLRIFYHGRPGVAVLDNGETQQREFDVFLRTLARHNGDAFFAWQSWTHTDPKGGQESYCATMNGGLKCMLKIVKHEFAGRECLHTHDHSKCILELPSRENYHPRWVYVSGSNAVNTQILRGSITIGFKNVTLNKLLRCSLLVVDFEGYYVDYLKNPQTIPKSEGRKVFQLICNGCGTNTECSKKFNHFDKMYADVKKKREEKAAKK
ncbi:hypothetical protein QR680_011320 [Steinernema hermaphroditum]|uniref:Uncharacterized protein n=1 Tax=Steinernema hermaphroditum TaxID=289476 RepID=A0AA39ITA3_9BILA|nr:hypothetical protein QR680_011320 [Steinernema hermaphroditum]